MVEFQGRHVPLKLILYLHLRVYAVRTLLDTDLIFFFFFLLFVEEKKDVDRCIILHRGHQHLPGLP